MMKQNRNKIKKEMQGVFLYIPVEMMEKLDEKAKEIGIARASVIKLIIRNYLKKEEERGDSDEDSRGIINP